LKLSGKSVNGYKLISYWIPAKEHGESGSKIIYCIQDLNKNASSLNLPAILIKGNLEADEISIEGLSIVEANQLSPKVRSSLSSARETGIDPPLGNSVPAYECEANGGTMVEIEWWYQIFDENGNLLFEEYVYSTYECWGAGQGGGTPTNSQVCQLQAGIFMAQGNASSELLNSTVEETNLEKKVFTTWTIYKAGTWSISSIDRVIFNRPNLSSGWIFSSYTHLGDAAVGAIYGGTRTYNILSTEITNNWNIKVNLRIDYTVTSTAKCSFIPSAILPPITTAFNANRIISAGPMTLIDE
jgi:hypothetical protein